MINIEFVQLNIACISEDTGIKVYKSDGSSAKFKPNALTQWCFLDGKASILGTRKRDCHFFLNKEFVLSCASLRPSLKSTLTRGLFLYFPTPGGNLCSAHFTISLVYLWSYPKGKLMTWGQVELCVWSLIHPKHRHPAIFSLLRVVSGVNYASSLDKRALFSLGLEYIDFYPQHDPQYRRERLLVSFTQPLTGTSIIFLKLNILSLAKKELR